MQLHNLSSHNHKKSRRVGRGGKRGSYSGKGIKGQKSRSGHRIRPQLRDILKKIPKRRGSGKSSRQVNLHKRKLAVINLGSLEANFELGETITPFILVRRGLVRQISGRVPNVKVLGGGSITKPMIIKNCAVSNQARAMLEKVGGRIA